MKAAFLDPSGVPFVRDVDDPEPASDLVTVRVRRAALHLGNLLGAGERPLGSEAVGIVEHAPADSPLAPGDRVGTFPAWGVVRERIALTPERVFAVSDEVPDDVAAQLYVNALTAQMVLRAFERTTARTGDDGPLIVSGAASALGRILLADAQDRGYDVVAVVRRVASAERVAAGFGVPAVATSDAGWRAELARILDGRAAAAVADAHGGPDGHALWAFLARGGSVLQWGDLSGEPVGMRASELLPTELRLEGVSVSRWLEAVAAGDRAADVARVEVLARTRPELFRVAQRFTLDTLGPALERLRRTDGSGTVLVDLMPDQ
ncbi:hypothetical protein [Conexibacter sp. CPCC 206217]|uniref:hypothetical protein n=1 Tax=Conexibacter sp. CPCC 206217 TaxID=3064574 RepID=UPI002727C810|nr:hypothetical protein [Conexibacter sp. CPCC 206217]MDO8209612.1 hypothetical protein [Conexibacter sp. CPCC 206217]